MPEETDAKNKALVYINNAKMAMTEEEALLVFYSSNQIFQFVFSPRHVKRLEILLQKHLAAWEKKHGRIKTKLERAKNDTGEREAIGFQERPKK